MGSGDERRLREVALEVTSQAGFDLEELVVRSAGRRRVVRVVIDGDGGVTLDAAADISRAISERLDAIGEDDPAGTLPYTLEVTSPGVGRPLTLPRHFRRARTRLVALVTNDGRTVTGHVLAAGEDGVTLVLNGRKGLSELEVAYADIDRAKVEVEFSAPSAAVLAKLGVQAPAEPADGDDDADDDSGGDDHGDDGGDHSGADDPSGADDGDDEDGDDGDDDDGDDGDDDADQTDHGSSTELDDANEGMNR